MATQPEPLAPEALALPAPSRETTLVSLDDDERKLRNRLAARKSRSMRKSIRETMESQVRTFECVLANLMFVSDGADQTSPDGFLDDDESRSVRDFLVRTKHLQLDKVRLMGEQSELRRMLHEHQTFHALVRRLRAEQEEEEDWNWRVLRWRALTRASFEPWTPEQYDAAVDETMDHIERFTKANEAVTSGLTFMGWREKRQVDDVNSAVEFSVYKTNNGDAEVDSGLIWNLERSHKDYARIKAGPNCRAFSEVLQEIDEDRCIVRVVEKCANTAVVVHMVMLLFRVRIGESIYTIKRAVPIPEVQAALPDEDAVWGSNFYWSRFDTIERDADGNRTKYRVAAQGTLCSSSEPVVRRWLTEIVFIIVRMEQWCQGLKTLLG